MGKFLETVATQYGVAAGKSIFEGVLFLHRDTEAQTGRRKHPVRDASLGRKEPPPNTTRIQSGMCPQSSGKGTVVAHSQQSCSLFGKADSRKAMPLAQQMVWGFSTGLGLVRHLERRLSDVDLMRATRLPFVRCV